MREPSCTSRASARTRACRLLHTPQPGLPSPSPAAVCTWCLLPWGSHRCVGNPRRGQITGGAQLGSRPSSMMAALSPCPGHL